jgi:hypothetical protein
MEACRKIFIELNGINVLLLWRHVYLQTVVPVNWHYNNPTQRVGLEQSGSHHHLIEN